MSGYLSQNERSEITNRGVDAVVELLGNNGEFDSDAFRSDLGEKVAGVFSAKGSHSSGRSVSTDERAQSLRQMIEQAEQNGYAATMKETIEQAKRQLEKLESAGISNGFNASSENGRRQDADRLIDNITTVASDFSERVAAGAQPNNELEVAMSRIEALVNNPELAPYPNAEPAVRQNAPEADNDDVAGRHVGKINYSTHDADGMAADLFAVPVSQWPGMVEGWMSKGEFSDGEKGYFVGQLGYQFESDTSDAVCAVEDMSEKYRVGADGTMEAAIPASDYNVESPQLVEVLNEYSQARRDIMLNGVESNEACDAARKAAMRLVEGGTSLMGPTGSSFDSSVIALRDADPNIAQVMRFHASSMWMLDNVSEWNADMESGRGRSSGSGRSNGVRHAREDFNNSNAGIPSHLGSIFDRGNEGDIERQYKGILRARYEDNITSSEAAARINDLTPGLLDEAVEKGSLVKAVKGLQERAIDEINSIKDTQLPVMQESLQKMLGVTTPEISDIRDPASNTGVFARHLS